MASTAGVIMVPFHVLAGMLALVFGYTALFTKKGGPVHRKSGMGFTIAMIIMSLSGAGMGFLKNTPTNVIAGLLTFYFVITGLLTVRRGATPEWIRVALVVIALLVGFLALQQGRHMIALGRPEGAPLLVFTAMAWLGAIGDVRVIRAGSINGRRRLSRHLWRMCFAMWVAAASFFWGPPGRVPEIINIPALLPIPVLTPIVVMLYWLWRMRKRRTSTVVDLPVEVMS
jgi:uncharacterized membrane protein